MYIKTLTVPKYVLNVVRTVNFELRRISSIRRLLTTEATATLVSAFIFHVSTTVPLSSLAALDL